MAHAGGKVILLGEHAVVYGVPAIAAGIPLGARAEARRAACSRLRLGPRWVEATAPAPDDRELASAFLDLLAELGERDIELEVDLDLPAGVGLGASAAIAVAAGRAVLELDARAAPGAETPEQRARVLRAALRWERVFHGNPSGVDTAAAAHGGCIRFVKGDGPKPLRVKAPLCLALAVAGPPASTKLMVDGVRKLGERRPDLLAKSLEGIRTLVRNAEGCIEAGDRAGLGTLLDLNQMLLSGLFVSSEGIERACQLARDAGALGAKLTGAGGGGCVVALVDGEAEADAEPVLEAWRGAGLQCFASRVADRDAARLEPA